MLDALALNHEGIAYHANSVIKSEVFQLARRDDEDRYLHLIAFIAHQYYRLQDNLVDVLITSLQSYQNSALREHKDQCYARREQRNPSLGAGVFPTKVRKTPRDLPQTGYTQRDTSFRCSHNQTAFRPLILGA